MFANLRKELEKQRNHLKDVNSALDELTNLESRGQLIRESEKRLEEIKKEEDKAKKSADEAKSAVVAALAQADTIKAKAKDDAEKIVFDANKKSVQIIEEAKRDSKEYDKKIAQIADKQKVLDSMDKVIEERQAKLDRITLETNNLLKKFA